MGSVNRSEEFVSWEVTGNYEDVIRAFFYTIDFFWKVDIEVQTNHGKVRFQSYQLPEYFTTFNGFCRQFDHPSIDLHQATEIHISALTHYQVFLADPSLFVHYMIHSESLKGDQLETWDNQHNYYSIELEEVHWNPDSGECMVYGTTESVYASFADCIASEHEEMLTPILGCMVPWLTRPNSSTICKGKIHVSPVNYTKFSQTIDELYRTKPYRTIKQSKNCLKPCDEVRATSARKSFKSVGYYPAIQEVSLHFPLTVKVTR